MCTRLPCLAILLMAVAVHSKAPYRDARESRSMSCPYKDDQCKRKYWGDFKEADIAFARGNSYADRRKKERTTNPKRMPYMESSPASSDSSEDESKPKARAERKKPQRSAKPALEDPLEDTTSPHVILTSFLGVAGIFAFASRVAKGLSPSCPFSLSSKMALLYSYISGLAAPLMAYGTTLAKLGSGLVAAGEGFLILGKVLRYAGKMLGAKTGRRREDDDDDLDD